MRYWIRSLVSLLLLRSPYGVHLLCTRVFSPTLKFFQKLSITRSFHMPSACLKPISLPSTVSECVEKTVQGGTFQILAGQGLVSLHSGPCMYDEKKGKAWKFQSPWFRLYMRINKYDKYVPSLLVLSHSNPAAGLTLSSFHPCALLSVFIFFHSFS